MKKALPAILFLALSISASAIGRDNNFSNSRRKSDKTTVSMSQHKPDDIFGSISRQYSDGKISADSVVRLALYHKAGRPDVAEQCLKLAADRGHVKAITELGVLYTFSPTFAKHTGEGVKLLQTASKAGDKEADGYLGYYYFTKKDYSKAKSHLEASRPMTNGIEYATLGSMYLEGKGVHEDGAKAREHFRQSALLGLPRGMALYASLLGTKNGDQTNYPDSFFWFYIAGELGDNYSRVMLYRPRLPETQAGTEVGKDAQTALTWIEAVHSGKSMKNEPVYKDGFLKGLKAREQAAEHGDDWSRFYLGGMNYNGDFLNQNYAQALRYYDAIAENAKLPAPMLALVHERLATMYSQGKGVKANPVKAANHYRLAANYGSIPAYKIVENIK